MSLVAAALQIATVKALDGVISAKVFDSMVDPLQLKDEPIPVAVVCAVEGRQHVEGLGYFEGSQSIDLVIDLGVARKVIRTVGEGQQAIQVEFPDTDAGHDIVLHTLGFEVLKALFASNSAWADLWRQLVARATAEPSIWERGASAENGVRLAVIRHVMRLEVVNEPPIGGLLPELWGALLGAMDADSELAQIAKLWRALITTPTLPDWRVQQAQLGLNLSDMFALGPAPMFDTTSDPPPANVEISAVDEVSTITGDADQATITEDGGDAVVIAE